MSCTRQIKHFLQLSWREPHRARPSVQQAKRGLESDGAVQGQWGESWPWTQATIGLFQGLQGVLPGGELWGHRKSLRLEVGKVLMAILRVAATAVPPITSTPPWA